MIPCNKTATSPEIKLLLACLSPHLDPGRFAGSAIDWPRLERMATNHHVIPLVYRALKGHPALPADTLLRLRRARMQIAAHSLRASCILQRLQEKLVAGRVTLVPIKGPALALLAYGQESMRQFEDLDLVVHPRDMPRALELLAEEGYQALIIDPKVRQRYLATRQDWGLHREGDPVTLELKPAMIWHPLCGEDSVDYLTRSCRPLPMDERRTLSAPGPEAMLLALCIDGVKDMWCKLSAVADVAHLLTRHPEAAWQELLVDAARLGQRRTLLVGVHVAGSLLDCPLPEAFRAALQRDRTARRLAAQAVAATRTQAPAQNRIGRQCVFIFQARERVRDRLAFIARLLFVPSPLDLNLLPLPPALYPVYALTRPFRLGWDVLTRRKGRRLPRPARHGEGRIDE